MEALSKVLTSADFHPIDCHTFLYSSSRGCVRLGDMRAAALCDASAKSFEASRDTSETLPREALPSHSLAVARGALRGASGAREGPSSAVPPP